MGCPNQKSCQLCVTLGGSPGLAVWKTLFCDSGYARCIRFRLASAGALIPPDMLPDGRTHLARGAVASAPLEKLKLGIPGTQAF